MADFITLITSVLDIEFTVGTVTLTLGALAIGGLILGTAVGFFRRVSKSR